MLPDKMSTLLSRKVNEKQESFTRGDHFQTLGRNLNENGEFIGENSDRGTGMVKLGEQQLNCKTHKLKLFSFFIVGLGILNKSSTIQYVQTLIFYLRCHFINKKVCLHRNI